VIPRYSRPAMTGIWSEESKLARWLEVELAALDGWAELGAIPTGDADACSGRAQRGLELSLGHGVRNVLYTIGATESFNRRNGNRYPIEDGIPATTLHGEVLAPALLRIRELRVSSDECRTGSLRLEEVDGFAGERDLPAFAEALGEARAELEGTRDRLGLAPLAE